MNTTIGPRAELGNTTRLHRVFAEFNPPGAHQFYTSKVQIRAELIKPIAHTVKAWYNSFRVSRLFGIAATLKTWVVMFVGSTPTLPTNFI